IPTDVPTRPTRRLLDIARRLDRHVSRLCTRHRSRRRKTSRRSNQKAPLPHRTLLMCCSECPRTSIGGCTLRIVLPPVPFLPYVSKTTHILTTFGLHHPSSYLLVLSHPCEQAHEKVVPADDALVGRICTHIWMMSLIARQPGNREP